MKNFGRHRQSIVDIQQELHDIFCGHPQCYNNTEGVVSLPVRCLSDVFDTYREEYGVELLTENEMAGFMQIVDASPDVEATPDTILQLVAMRTSSGQQIHPEDHLPNADDWSRGRTDERDHHGSHLRSSSNGSTTGYNYPTPGSRPPSRPPSRGVGGMPRTPGAKESPFDAQKRQRSTPLAPVAPSSWTRRPAAPGRRKSDASNHGRPVSDSEVSAFPHSFSVGHMHVFLDAPYEICESYSSDVTCTATISGPSVRVSYNFLCRFWIRTFGIIARFSRPTRPDFPS